MSTLTDDDQLDVIEDDEDRPKAVSGRVWRMLLVDDDDAVHASTAYSLRGTEIFGRGLELSHAKSGAEALALLRRDPDFAVVLLDVVMETADAGLQVVRSMREELKLTLPRIILRTGQPGYAPELTVIRDYDINDYRTKSELTRTRLLTSLHTALRTYSHIQALETSRRGLEQIIGASAGLFRRNSLQTFCEGVLLQLAGLLDIAAEGFVIARTRSAASRAMAPAGHQEPLILAGAGPFRTLSGTPLHDVRDDVLRSLLSTALERRASAYLQGATVLHIEGRNGDDLAVYIATDRDMEPVDRQLLEVFSSNVALGFDNVSLLDDIRAQAYRDPLTRLPNRTAFLAEMAERLDRSATEPGRLFVLLLDLDHFQAANDGLGHGIGDSLLLAVAERLHEVFPEAGTLSRITGDAFGALAVVESDRDVQNLIGAVELCFVRPFVIDGHPLDVGVSGGYVLDEGDGCGNGDVNRLFRRAGMALKGAKRSGRGRVLRFDPTMEAVLHDRLSLVSRIPEAQSSGQFTMVCQPQLRLSDGAVIGAEALLRWRLPDGNWVAPDRFIPVAEDSGHILQLGEWMLRQACVQQVRWRDGAVGRLRMAVNVSVRQLRDGTFVRIAERILSDSNADPADIELEITESNAMENDQILGVVRSLRDMGFSIAIDDFGTGYSSLSRLHQLPASVLKIDRFFVTDIDSRPENRSIAATIVKVGHEMGMSVLAEGVETASQEAVLRALDCDLAQGYLYAKPLPPDSFEHWLIGRRGAVPRSAPAAS